MDIKKTVEKMTLEEKIALVSGTDFMYTNPIERLGIRALSMSDGPHGLRKLKGENLFGVDESEPATAFPTAVSCASSWNTENARKMGDAIAKECLNYSVDILLGPGINIKKNPVCGRNFEYYSEDPHLAGKMGAAFVSGVQKNGVGVALKHFALNNSENFRFMGDSICDERAAREIYLKPFETVVKESAPDTIMCAYNKVRGEYCSENKWLLTDVLRDEWGFSGAVMSDWGATHDRALGIRSGLDLEMPGDSDAARARIYEAVRSGELPCELLDTSCARILTLLDKYENNKQTAADFDENHALAERIATDSAVLLKNDGILPLNCKDKFTVIGELFENMRYQGAGSSMINATRVTTPKNRFDGAGINYSFYQGYCDDALLTDDIKYSTDTVIIFAGLTDNTESEGEDRKNLSISDAQLEVIKRATKSGKRCVVILFGGAVMELPFADEVSAILYMGLPGQAGGDAVYKLLFGEANPCGRLAESWPVKFSDVPLYDTFAKSKDEIYRDSIFVGYRYYTAAKVPVRYRFGYGLSYTKFKYTDMTAQVLDKKISVDVTVKNVGEYYGGEVIQLYSRMPDTAPVFHAVRELRAFDKIYLAPDEEKRVNLVFDIKELSYYNTALARYVLIDGEHTIDICSDCENVILSQQVSVKGEDVASPYSAEVMAVYKSADIKSVSDELFSKMSGLEIPAPTPKLPLTLESRFTDMKMTFFGRIIFRAVMSIPKKKLKKIRKMPDSPEKKNAVKGAHFLARMLESNSLNAMSYSSAGAAPMNLVTGLMHIANGKIFRGIKFILKKEKAPKLPKNSGK